MISDNVVIMTKSEFLDAEHKARESGKQIGMYEKTIELARQIQGDDLAMVRAFLRHVIPDTTDQKGMPLSMEALRTKLEIEFRAFLQVRDSRGT